MITRRLIRPSLSKLNQPDEPAPERDAPEPPPRDEAPIDGAPARESRYGGGYDRDDAPRRPTYGDRGGYADRPAYGDRPGYGDRGGYTPRPGGQNRYRPGGGYPPKGNFNKGAGGGPGGNFRKGAPPTDTYAENYYYKKQMEKKTPVIAIMSDGETIKGWIEWYDRDVLKINRDDGPNLLVYKRFLKYIYKDEEKAAQLEAQLVAAGGTPAAEGDHDGHDEGHHDDSED